MLHSWMWIAHDLRYNCEIVRTYFILLPFKINYLISGNRFPRHNSIGANIYLTIKQALATKNAYKYTASL